ncbi:mitochondrial ribosomal protein L31-domain-containing protein [Lipomyces doorenjongii]|uniref:mitochondrial 54S ribosomal protein mL60 n=1 Tax=Lipomyces doorenjongii TaxID=383834 RepID=UPI003343872A
MFGPFKPTNPAFSGLLWKIPWRMSAGQKYRQRKRLQAVDQVIATVEEGLKSKGLTCKALERLNAELPKENEMPSRDKYTTFHRRSPGYRIGLHKVAKWTKRSIRTNPKGF